MEGKKRANGEGTTPKRHPDGRWWARITLPNGKRKALYGKTRDEVSRKLTAALRDLHQGLPIVGEQQTLAQYLMHWLDTSARPKLRASTYSRYHELLRLHVLPELGKRRLAQLTPQDVQA